MRDTHIRTPRTTPSTSLLSRLRWWRSPDPIAVDYCGTAESVECAYPGCKRRLRYSAFGTQFCSKEHRDNV